MNEKKIEKNQDYYIPKCNPGLPIITYMTPYIEVEIDIKTITRPKLIRQTNYRISSPRSRYYNRTNNIMNILENSYK